MEKSMQENLKEGAAYSFPKAETITPTTPAEEEITQEQELKQDAETQKKKIGWNFYTLQIVALYYFTACDALAFSVIQPFLPAMAVENFGMRKENVGNVVGYVMGGFMLARFFSSTYLGYLSDRFGRKKFLMLSLFVSIIGTSLFGVFSNIYIAFGVRFIEGMLSATGGVSKAMLVDLSSDDNRSLVFGYLGSVFALSRVFSSSIGGMTVGIFDYFHWPKAYLGACILCAIIVLSAFILSLFMPETLKKNNKKKPENIWQGFKISFLQNRLTSCLTLMTAVNAFCNSGFIILIVLTAQERIEYGGLGFDPFGIGILFVIFGAVCFIFQVSFFKKILGRFGLIRTYMFGSIFQTISCGLIPLLPLANWFIHPHSIWRQVAVWTTCTLTTTIGAAGFMLLLPTIQTLVVNTTSLKRQGLVQGCTQSVQMLARAFGTTTAGGLFSLGASYRVSWIACAFFAAIFAITGFAACLIPRSCEKKIKEEDEDEAEVAKDVSSPPVELTSVVVSQEASGLEAPTALVEVSNSPADTNQNSSDSQSLLEKE